METSCNLNNKSQCVTWTHGILRQRAEYYGLNPARGRNPLTAKRIVRIAGVGVLAVGLACGVPARAAGPSPAEPNLRIARKSDVDEPEKQADIQPDRSDGTEPEEARSPDRAGNRERTDLNLLGEVDADAGESRRNENVQLTLVDNNVLKEINVRMGTSATIIRDFEIAGSYFGSEFGTPPERQIHLEPLSNRLLHGEFYETHGNSLFSARSFFQVGAVRPARSNNYGLRLQAPLPGGSALSVEAGQQKNRGSVNGNVLIPRPDERTPLASDPALRAIVSRILDSFPSEAPNRPDIDLRAHNTNAPQSIDNDLAGGRLDLPAGKEGRAVLDFRFRRQAVDAFQLVKGQNPDTTTGSHDARITWSKNWSPDTTSTVSAGFRRMTSLIVQDESAVGPVIWTGRQLQTLGTPTVPYDRAQNFFRYEGLLATDKRRHRARAGFSVAREHLNGIESSAHNGLLMFSANFGRDTVSNLRYGTPTMLAQSIGSTHRGFRRWKMQVFAGDTWTVGRSLTLSLGLRYEPATRPREVNGLSAIPYRCDCNNFAPRFGFAFRTPGLGVLRGAYGLHYGEIFAATYSQVRFNPPGNILLSAVDPDLLNPLAGLKTDSLDPGARSGVVRIAPDLVAPYSHQYNASWEVAASGGWYAQLGYVGSRTHRLLSAWVFNRARPQPGDERTTETVNARRPDSRYFEVRHLLNGSRASFDAARATAGVREWRGATAEFSYWFSKAIDLGAHYANNATFRDAFTGMSQTESDVHADVKAVSEFDQPHAAVVRFGYRLPQVGALKGLWGRAFGGWRLSAVLLVKSGTPFTIYTGSDAPGFGNVDGLSGDRPHIVDPSVLGRTIDHPDSARERLPRAAFRYIGADESRGTLPRHAVRKDGIRNVNLAVSREWTLAGRVGFSLRAESVNLFNPPQFANPGNELSGSNFGQITNTLNDGRTFSLAARLSF